MIHLMICLLPLFFVAGVFVGWRIKKEERHHEAMASAEVEPEKSFPPKLVRINGTRD